MTSHSPRTNYPGEYSIKRWREAGLIKPTTVRLGKTPRISTNDFQYKIGSLHVEDRKNVIRIIDKMYPNLQRPLNHANDDRRESVKTLREQRDELIKEMRKRNNAKPKREITQERERRRTR
ncbi:MAG: hypothetical protein J6M18_05200 [Actinomycetaceae bacterium]|nr:hypothetical protein [Actinomycetaceae bacterium]